VQRVGLLLGSAEGLFTSARTDILLIGMAALQELTFPHTSGCRSPPHLLLANVPGSPLPAVPEGERALSTMCKGPGRTDFYLQISKITSINFPFLLRQDLL
jgi:hypothetical protein